MAFAADTTARSMSTGSWQVDVAGAVIVVSSGHRCYVMVCVHFAVT